MLGRIRLVVNLSVDDMYAGYPLARKVLSVAVIAFAIYNFASWLGSVTASPVYERWLNASQPFTDVMAAAFPAIDSSTAYLKTHNGSYMIPVARNLLSINFALLMFLPSCVAGAACTDLLRNPQIVARSVDEIFQKVRMPIKEIGVRSSIMFLAIFGLLYSGLVSDPFVMGYTTTIAYYAFVFGGGSLYFAITVCSVTSVIALKLRPPNITPSSE